jgi:hypothetical protein
MELNVDLEASFDNVYDWKGIRQKAREVTSTKPYITNDETSWYILNGCYTNMYACVYVFMNVCMYINIHTPANCLQKINIGGKFVKRQNQLID